MRKRSTIRNRLVLVAILTGAAVGVPTAVVAGGGCHADTGSGYTEGPASVVRMDLCDFGPTVSRVPVGTEVRFLNTDQVPHIVIGRRLTWASAELVPGAEYVQRFDVAGTYPYMCSFHPGMVGAIVVGDATQAAAPEDAAASDAPSLAAATTTDDADDGPATGIVVAFGVLTLVAGLTTGWLIGRRRTSMTGRP
jgi:plastocyanin